MQPTLSVLSASAILATGLLLPIVSAQHAPHLMYTVHGDAGNDNFGSAVSHAGDVDNDGCSDFIIGARWDDNKGTSSGSARVFSGQDGKILYTWDGDNAGDQLGFVVANAGDANLDGHDDLIVGAPFAGSSTGYARVFSGRDGSILHTFNGASGGDSFGYSVSGGFDVNLDGHDDVVVGARGDDNNGRQDSGSATVFSGRDGSVLWQFDGAATKIFFGHSVALIGDTNLDTFGDIAVGAPNDDTNGTNAGLVQVFSGLDGRLLYTFHGDAGGDLMGTWVAAAFDSNLDGHMDIVAGAHRANTDQGMARVYSGRDGSTLHTHHGNPSEAMGSTVSSAGDIDADGYPDVLIGNASLASLTKVYSGRTGALMKTFQGCHVGGGGDINGDGYSDVIVGTTLFSGLAWVMSGTELSLRSDTHRLPVASGGKQSFTIDAGAANANRDYWIFGSVTGTKPGLKLLGLEIPLNPDVYTDLAMVNVAANPPFENFRGKLSGTGTASASITIPNTLPSIAFSLWHAMLVFDANQFHFVSNPAPLRLY